MKKAEKLRVGIYAGTFDPVHSGHISFALQSVDQANLGQVYFLPERKPLYKTSAEHYGHRVAMLRQAIRPHERLALVEVVERRFSVNKTIITLEQAFAGDTLVLLMGADIFVQIPDWKDVDILIKKVEFVVSVRSQNDLKATLATIAHLGIPSKSVHVIDSPRPEVSGAKMRYALRRHVDADGLLTSVHAYARREWLYASVKQTI